MDQIASTQKQPSAYFVLASSRSPTNRPWVCYIVSPLLVPTRTRTSYGQTIHTVHKSCAIIVIQNRFVSTDDSALLRDPLCHDRPGLFNRFRRHIVDTTLHAGAT